MSLTDSRQEAAVIDAMQRERTDEYRERMMQGAREEFHKELEFETAPSAAGPCTPSWRSPTPPTSPGIRSGSSAIRARDYFNAPGGEEAAAAVASCEEALARFESEALAAELEEPARRPGPVCTRSTRPTADNAYLTGQPRDLGNADEERDPSLDGHVARQPGDRDRRGGIESFVTLQVTAVQLLADRKVDLPLRRHPQLLEEPAHRHVERLFVHRSSFHPL